MIKKYIFGNPIETGAVTANIEPCEGVVEHFNEIETDEGIIFNYAMHKEDIVYGLGEANRGMNKRGGMSLIRRRKSSPFTVYIILR